MVTLRRATHADYEFLYQLHVMTLRAYIEVTWGWNEAWQREYFDQKFDPHGRQIIQIEGVDAGVLVVEERPQELYLALIEILPQFQRHGVGTGLIKGLLARAHSQNLALALHVLKSNKPAQELYRRLGFSVVEEEQTRFKMISAPPRDDREESACNSKQ